MPPEVHGSTEEAPPGCKEPSHLQEGAEERRVPIALAGLYWHSVARSETLGTFQSHTVYIYPIAASLSRQRFVYVTIGLIPSLPYAYVYTSTCEPH